MKRTMRRAWWAALLIANLREIRAGWQRGTFFYELETGGWKIERLRGELRESA